MRLRLGTRRSALAVTQSEQVAGRLRELGHEVDLVRVTTTGDVTTGSLSATGSLGVFAAELRTAVLDGRCDFAVHSLKDLPTGPVPGLVLASIPTREDDGDALCARDGLTFADLPANSSVGTGSPRRVAQLRALRPDLRYVDIRGNLGTRLARVSSGDLDAVVLAVAGLRRLGIDGAITDRLPILPAPGQGALALECRADDEATIGALLALDDPDTRLAVEQERALLAALGGGCAAPIAAVGARGMLRAGVFAVDGSASVTVEVPLEAGAGGAAAALLLDRGAASVTELDATRPSRLADLHDDTSLWGGSAVLAGMRVLLPRADGALAEGLRAAGAEVTARPLQRRVDLPQAGPLPSADWVALTSPATMDALDALGLTLPPGARVAAVGEATAATLRARGIVVDLVPAVGASAAALLDAWPAGRGRVLLPGSALASPELADGLAAKGYDVERVPVYAVEPLREAPAGLVEEYADGQFDAVVVTSGSVGRAVDALLGWRPGVFVVAFGEPTAAALREMGVAPRATAETQDAAGVIAALASMTTGER